MGSGSLSNGGEKVTCWHFPLKSIFKVPKNGTFGVLGGSENGRLWEIRGKRGVVTQTNKEVVRNFHTNMTSTPSGGVGSGSLSNGGEKVTCWHFPLKSIFKASKNDTFGVRGVRKWTFMGNKG